MSSTINELKNCTSEEEVINLFKNEKFPNGGGSGFLDEKILVINSGNIYGNIIFKLDGLYDLCARTLIYLKFGGYLQSCPQNTGEIKYASSIQIVLRELGDEIDSVPKNIGDIQSTHIDSFIEKHLKNGSKATLVSDRIALLIEWMEYANHYLPIFMRLDHDILCNSVQYSVLKRQETKERISIYDKITSPKEPYPLSDLKTILSHSIGYIEKYGEECLEISRLIADTVCSDYYTTYSKTFDYLNKRENLYRNKIFLGAQIKCKQEKNKMIDGKRSVASLRTTLVDEIDILEASCVSIILMLTGMRVGELVTLERFPEIREDEYFNLKRIVYKTASTANGESLEMPIPKIVSDALGYLSELAKIKDGANTGRIILTSLLKGGKKHKPVRTARINTLLESLRQTLLFDKMPEPHQFRHAMAFLIVHLNESDGLELARMFLGHTSIIMTLQYMGHFNLELRDAIEILTKEESEMLAESIVGEIQNNKRLFGENGKRLMPNHKFVGKQASEFSSLLRKGLKQLIQEKRLAIIQTPVSLCMHDLSKPEQMECQRGFNILDIVANGPAPARCKGANCSNSLFFEEHIEKIKNDMYADIEPELRKRLEQNTYFMESGGFEQDPFRKLIEEYTNYKKEPA